MTGLGTGPTGLGNAPTGLGNTPQQEFYAYRVTGVSGCMNGRIEVGQHILENEYKGNGSYTWTIFDFKKGDVSGTFTGRYIGKVAGRDGKLDAASQHKLGAAE